MQLQGELRDLSREFTYHWQHCLQVSDAVVRSFAIAHQRGVLMKIQKENLAVELPDDDADMRTWQYRTCSLTLLECHCLTLKR